MRLGQILSLIGMIKAEDITPKPELKQVDDLPTTCD